MRPFEYDLYKEALGSVLRTEAGTMALTGILLRMGALRAVSADPEERALHNMADALLEEMREAAPDRALLITANLRGLGDVLRVVNKGVSDG